MSLYGALFGGVSGLSAQSSRIGVISDNIANVNTVGYKQGQATFETLVVNSSNASSYQTGGVRGGTRSNIDKQGLLQSTDSPTDLALSGRGFFVVKSSTEVAQSSVREATPLFTRAGSFRQDSLGNFVNPQGYLLQGWPLDREGRLPGEVGNLNTTSFTNFDSLVNVNVESASGVAQATTVVSLGANLNAGENVFRGKAGTLRPDINTPNNLNIGADAILAGAEYGLAPADSLSRGDRFNVSTGNGLTFSYEYGGYTVGRQITSAFSLGDAGINNKALVSLNNAADIRFAAAGASSFDITIPNHNLITGDSITLTGFAAPVGATPAGQLNATHTVTRIDANTLRITVATPHAGVAGANAGPGGVTANTRIFGGNVFDAGSATQAFLGLAGANTFTDAAKTFTITTPTVGTRTFTYVTSSPNALTGQFNNLNSLAEAINQVSGLTARVINGRLNVGSEDASEAVTFANGDAVGSGGATVPQRGLDWVSELDLANVSTGNRRYSNLQALADLVKGDEGISSTISNSISNASLQISVDDPLDTIRFDDLANLPASIPTVGTPIAIPATAAGSAVDIVINTAPPSYLAAGDNVYISGLTSNIGGLSGSLPNGGPFNVVSLTAGSYTIRIPGSLVPSAVAGGSFNGTANNKVSVAGKSNQGSPLAALSLVSTLGGAAYTPQTTGVLGPLYDSSGTVGQNLASGDLTAQFSRNIRIYDALGAGHDIRYSFIKIAPNNWAVEVHAIPPEDVNTTLADGQVAVGTISFNGDGSLRSVSPALTNAITVNWRNGSVPSEIRLNFGTAGQPFGTTGATTIGLTDGLSQFNSAYNVAFANQNGAPVGQLVSVQITEQGLVVASYSNGETQNLFQLPVADFPNVNGLSSITGNVFRQNRDSGEVNLREAGTNGTGTIVAASLEQSNVDLAEQLTDLIVAQRSYQANTKVITTTDQLLQQLNQLTQ